MRVAWFSPLPPARSGIAAYSADVAAAARRATLRRSTASPRRQRRATSCGGAPHSLRSRRLPARQRAVPRLHVGVPRRVSGAGRAARCAAASRARARSLLAAAARRRLPRASSGTTIPDAARDFAEYAVEGLGGPIYYFWPMLRVVMRTARAGRGAQCARRRRPARRVSGRRASKRFTSARRRRPAGRRRAVDEFARRSACRTTQSLFAAFGKITAEKRDRADLRAFGADRRASAIERSSAAGRRRVRVRRHARSAWPASAHGSRIHVTGYMPRRAIGDYLAAADVCLCLRWPTALETSASWLQCLAPGGHHHHRSRPLVDVPSIDPRSRRSSTESAEPVAIAVDPLTRTSRCCSRCVRSLDEPPLRDALARAGQAYWSANHTLDLMTGLRRSDRARPRGRHQSCWTCRRTSATTTRAVHARSRTASGSRSTRSWFTIGNVNRIR